MKKKILFIISSAAFIGPNKRKTGYYLPEVTHPHYEFLQAGYEVDFVSIEGGEPPVDGLEVEDPLNKIFLESDAWNKINNTQSVADVDTSEYVAVFVPGGLGPVVDMPENEHVQRILADFYDRGDVVGAVCHGPVALLNVKLKDGSYLVADKNVASFSNSEEEGYAKEDVPFLLESALVERGAKYASVEDWQPYSVTDERLVTGQNPASAKGVAEKMMALLEQKEVASEVAAG